MLDPPLSCYGGLSARRRLAGVELSIIRKSTIDNNWKKMKKEVKQERGIVSVYFFLIFLQQFSTVARPLGLQLAALSQVSLMNPSG